MNIIGIIPARMGSSRFPRKPMKPILGMPMIGHVYKRCKLSKALIEVYVATCDKEIFDYVEKIGGKAIMTKDTHERCTERVSEALLKIEDSENIKADIIVMIQGDEPMVTPSMIDKSIQPLLENKEVVVSNLMAPIKTVKEHDDPNEIKVVVDVNNFALYFSREPIPTRVNGSEIPMNKQVCVIPFQRDYLLEFNQLAPTRLEVAESIDMLRVMEHGKRVKMVPITEETFSVDTKEDLIRVEHELKNDQYISVYM